MGHGGNTTPVVIEKTTIVVCDRHDTNTITMVARESCWIIVRLKKVPEELQAVFAQPVKSRWS